ncbi:MAG: HU family DNA-binding protein [Desulfovibrionaceae bacterium]|nr:HU family DNA-binding protein [Desulfovibrionaceae bacterium]
MTKNEFVEKLAEKTGLEKTQAEQVLNSFTKIIEETLQVEDRLAIVNFGTFSVSERKERQGRNPQTGAPLTIPACKVVKFNPGKQLREAVNVAPAEGTTGGKTEGTAEADDEDDAQD